jgi:hypothetical protein
MNDILQNAKLLGYVQLHIGSQVFALPVQSVHLDSDEQGKTPGGFFVAESGQCGILVDETAGDTDVQEQIERASADAVRHISRRFLN